MDNALRIKKVPYMFTSYGTPIRLGGRTPIRLGGLIRLRCPLYGTRFRYRFSVPLFGGTVMIPA